MYQEKVIGFDAREMYFSRYEDWTPERRAQFLLKDVEKPLSVDPVVWRSLFDIASPSFSLKAWPSVQWDGLYKSWGKLEYVLQAVKDWQDSLKPCWVIGITIFADKTEKENIEAYSDWRISPIEIEESWRLLGYDVADGSSISFLSNAGRGDEMPQNRMTWGTHLNEYHLFSNLVKAREYAAMCEGREPLHGPYAVFGLYLIQSFGL
jgi:hypothetical protein